MVWLTWVLVPRLTVPPASEADLSGVPVEARWQAQDSRRKLQNDARATGMQSLAGLAVLVGAFFTYRQLQINRRQLDHAMQTASEQQELDRQGQVTERFTRAVDQLGHEKLDVRLGGIYALERIAHDSPPDRVPIEELLSTFIRGHSPRRDGDGAQDVTDNGSMKQHMALRERSRDVQAALTVLGRRQPTVGRSWWPVDLFLTDLRGAMLQRAQLQNALLMSAQLQSAGLMGANLQNACLDGAELQGAHLSHAQLQGADLSGAQLQGARLDGAQLQGARCDAETVWPDGFDWKAAGVELHAAHDPASTDRRKGREPRR